MTRRKTGVVAAALAAVAAVAAVAAATAPAATRAPIVIGWAYDGNGAMAPFDGPALAAAQIRVKQVNAKGGVNGRRLQIKTCNTQGNKPAIARSCAAKLLSQGANVIFTTCDVDFAAPVVQEAINRGILAVAPCIGTDQMGPKRFGAKGRLAFSFGNVAQDEGSAMAQYAWSKGWKSASLATDTVIVYFKDVVKAFKVHAARRQDCRRGDVPVARLDEHHERRHASEREEGRRHRHRHGRCVRCAPADDLRAADARQQHAGPELLGR